MQTQELLILGSTWMGLQMQEDEMAISGLVDMCMQSSSSNDCRKLSDKFSSLNVVVCYKTTICCRCPVMTGTSSLPHEHSSRLDSFGVMPAICGHLHSVYAGALGEEEQPLSEITEQGLQNSNCG